MSIEHSAWVGSLCRYIGEGIRDAFGDIVVGFGDIIVVTGMNPESPFPYLIRWPNGATIEFRAKADELLRVA